MDDLIRTVDQCIYCGQRTDLTKEHTFPYSLWGERQLRDGSLPKVRQDYEPA